MRSRNGAARPKTPSYKKELSAAAATGCWCVTSFQLSSPLAYFFPGSSCETEWLKRSITSHLSIFFLPSLVKLCFISTSKFLQNRHIAETRELLNSSPPSSFVSSSRNNHNGPSATGSAGSICTGSQCQQPSMAERPDGLRSLRHLSTRNLPALSLYDLNLFFE